MEMYTMPEKDGFNGNKSPCRYRGYEKVSTVIEHLTGIPEAEFPVTIKDIRAERLGLKQKDRVVVPQNENVKG